MTSDPIDALLSVTEALEDLDVPYFVAGSVASVVHGLVRTTMDADVVLSIRPDQVSPLADRLDPSFFVDRAALAVAIAGRLQANIVHRDSMFKVDLHPMAAGGFDAAELSRRIRVTLSADGQRAAFVASAEDIVVAKLVWYRKGNEVSERQWRDVLGVLRAQSDRLDLRYVRSWALDLGVSDLLERALVAARS